jgi:hypothetical protein
MTRTLVSSVLLMVVSVVIILPRSPSTVVRRTTPRNAVVRTAPPRSVRSGLLQIGEFRSKIHDVWRKVSIRTTGILLVLEEVPKRLKKTTPRAHSTGRGAATQGNLEALKGFGVIK